MELALRIVKVIDLILTIFCLVPIVMAGNIYRLKEKILVFLIEMGILVIVLGLDISQLILKVLTGENYVVGSLKIITTIILIIIGAYQLGHNKCEEKWKVFLDIVKAEEKNTSDKEDRIFRN